jgi:hypothetical protein
VEDEFPDEVRALGSDVDEWEHEEASSSDEEEDKEVVDWDKCPSPKILNQSPSPSHHQTIEAMQY